MRIKDLRRCICKEDRDSMKALPPVTTVKEEDPRIPAGRLDLGSSLCFILIVIPGLMN